jgi:hypothetical protein
MEETAHKPSFGGAKKHGMQAMVAPVLAAAILCGIAGFIGGMHYQKGHQTTATAATGSQLTDGQFGSGTGRMGARGEFGDVTAVSSTSITINDTRSGAAKTLSISSDTAVTKDGNTASVSDIAAGDRVIVQTDTTDTTKATRITINPTMPSGGPGMQPGTTNQTN